MRIRMVTYNFWLLMKETFRNRMTLLLLVLIPAIFYLLSFYTTTKNQMLLKIASTPGERIVLVKEIEVGLIYIGLAVTGFIASFMALNLMQRNLYAEKRQILCGYKTSEIALSKFIFVIIIVIFTGTYIALMGLFMIDPKHVSGVLTGYILCGFVFGSIGLLAGAFIKRQLEGILFIVLLANLDLGWLQNPIFYATSQNRFIIRLLPGFNPAQVTLVSAFTDFSINSSVIYSLIYGSVFLIIAMIIFRIRLKTT
jgi:hypothetical protein